MKNQLLLLLLLCATFHTNAQESKQDFMAVPIISQQTFYLKAAAPGSNNSGSNQVLQINLPPNTVEWYYTVTTKPGHGKFSNNDLTGQLVTLVDPQRGISSKASPHVPAGTGIVDIYLMTNPLEVQKYVNNKPAGSFLMNDSRERFVSGAIPVKDYLDGSCFLVVLNPGSASGVNVNVEVTAVVLSSPVGSSTAMQ
jgi:hypothetical protein